LGLAAFLGLLVTDARHAQEQPGAKPVRIDVEPHGHAPIHPAAHEVGPQQWHGPTIGAGRFERDINWFTVGKLEVVFRLVFDRLSGVLV
ncbi:hypothetical protein WB403_50215, partial [Streptomyces brasiliscabiei]